MDIRRLQHVADFAPGTFNNTAMDASVNVSQYNHPALVPQLEITSGTTYTGAQIATNGWTSGGSAWTTLENLIYTAHANDAFTYTTASGDVQFSVELAGWLTSGMVHSGSATSGQIRNGGIVQVLEDGVLKASANLYEATTTITLLLDGAAGHAMTVKFTGQWGTGFTPIGTVQALVGTSVSAGLALSASSTQRSLVAASWRVLATSSSQFSLYTTPTGGTESLVASGLAVGTTYDSAGDVPGVSLKVSGTLTTNDSATFTTDSVMAAVLQMTAGAGSGSTTGSYTSPLYDSGAVDTQWLLAEFEASDLYQGLVTGVGGYTAPSLVFRTGATPTALTSTTIPLVDQLLPNGTRHGAYDGGLLTTPRGRYGQFVFTFPVGLTTLPWIRNVRLYSWVPERDPQFMDNAALASIPHRIDATMQAVYGLLATNLADTRQDMLSLVAAYTVGGATDQYLAQLAVDLGLPSFAYAGIPQATLQQFAQAALGSRPAGGTPWFLASQLGLLVGGSAPTTTVVTAADLQTATAGSSALTTGNVVVTQTAPWTGTISIPPPTGSGPTASYPGLPGVAIARAQAWLTLVITDFTPNAVKLATIFN